MTKITYARYTANAHRVDWRDANGNTIRIIVNPAHVAAARAALAAR